MYAADAAGFATVSFETGSYGPLYSLQDMYVSNRSSVACMLLTLTITRCTTTGDEVLEALTVQRTELRRF
jgi:hypothetical protein